MEGERTHFLPTWKKTQNIFYLPIYLPTCCHEKRGVWQWDLLQQSWSFHGGCPDVSSWSTAIDSSSHISATLQQQCTVKSIIFQSFPLKILHNSRSAESPSRIFFLWYVQEEICRNSKTWNVSEIRSVVQRKLHFEFRNLYLLSCRRCANVQCHWFQRTIAASHLPPLSKPLSEHPRHPVSTVSS